MSNRYSRPLRHFFTFAAAAGVTLAASFGLFHPDAKSSQSAKGENKPMAGKEETAMETEDGELKPLTNFAVVELYTSEGCSSCPPAEELLNELGKEAVLAGTTIIPLALHVDYWDRLGWKDELASPANTQRQREYAQAFSNRSIYTPQMVVNGTREFVGSSRSKAKAAIGEAGLKTTEAMRDSPPLPRISILRNEAGDITSVNAAGTGEAAFDRALGQQTLTYYLSENGFANKIIRGENSGRVLEHDYVVRASGALRLDEPTLLKSAMSRIDDRTNAHLTIVLQSRIQGGLPGEILAVWRTSLGTPSSR